MTATSTKSKVLNAARHLFAIRGYDSVSMRDIANEVGIKASSLYNHFPSKRNILKSIYQFYGEQQHLVAPSLDELLLLAETEEDPYKVLEALNYRYPPELQEQMDSTIIIASKGLKGNEDRESEMFIREYLFDWVINLIVPVLNRMVELGKIEPLNVEGLANITAHYTFGVAVLHSTDMKINWAQFQNHIAMIYSFIKPICPQARERTSVS